MHNSLFDMADDVGLLPVIGLPRDFLHWIILGLFGYHIVKAILYLLSKTISAAIYVTEHGSRKAPIKQSTMAHVLRRFARRLSCITSDADRPGTQQGGSRLFVLNVHMWQYGRPQPRTISVQERHARLKKARLVSGRKREARKDQMADRRARRRAILQEEA